MTSRERVELAINHKEPDRIPIDLGGTRTTGISIFSYNKLKEKLGIENGLSRVHDVYQMLGDVEPEVIERLNIDTLYAPKRSHRLRTRLSGWKKWQLLNGEWVFMPEGFQPDLTPRGDWIITDSDGSRARMPKGGYYFDYLEDTFSDERVDVDKLQFGDWTDEDYKFCGDRKC